MISDLIYKFKHSLGGFDLGIKFTIILLISFGCFTLVLKQLHKMYPKLFSFSKKIPKEWKGKWKDKWKVQLKILILTYGILMTPLVVLLLNNIISEITVAIMLGFYASLFDLVFEM